MSKVSNGGSFEAEVSDSVEVVSKLPSQLVSPFEGQPAYLKVVLDFITAPPEEYWVEGMTVELVLVRMLTEQGVNGAMIAHFMWVESEVS